MEFIKSLESEAQEQLDEVRKERVYKGSNPDYHKRAKIALGVIGAYVRLRATIANEHTNRLVEMRLLGDAPAAMVEAPVKVLKGA